jgi:hypothetical protein
MTEFRPDQRTAIRWIVTAAVVALIVAGAVTTGVLVTANRLPVAGAPVGTRLPDPQSPPPPGPGRPVLTSPTVVSAVASCTSGPGTDAAGHPFTYEAANAIDRQPDTAWRCDGDGVGARLTVTLAQPAVLTWIGVVPGFAKTDPYDGTDRYLQGRKIASARFVFDGGATVEHRFDTTDTSRAMQVVRFPPVATSRVEVVVLATAPGTPTNGFGATDKIAVAELSVG